MHFGDPTKSTGRSVCKYSRRRSAFVRTYPSVKPMRVDVATILGWLKISQTLHQLQRVVDSSTSSWSIETETAPQTLHQQFDSTQGLQLVPVQSVPTNTRLACHHSTSWSRHSSVRYSANRQGPTISISLNQCSRHCHQVGHAKHLRLVVTVLMMKMIHRA